jgi:hypothetical protein
MHFQSEVTKLKHSILAARERAASSSAPGVSWAQALWLLFVRQRRYLTWATTTYVTLLIEIVILQYQYGTFLGSSTLHILRVLSIFSLAPLVALHCLESVDLRELFFNRRENSRIHILALMAKALFTLKILFAFGVVVTAYHTPSFIFGAPLILQAIVLARAVASPWESTAGFLLLSKHGRLIMPGVAYSRSAGILSDLIGLVFVLLNVPYLYFLWHVGSRIFRCRWFFSVVLAGNYPRMFSWSYSEWSELKAILRALSGYLVPLILVWSIAEAGFFHLSVILSRYDSQAGLLLLIAHSQYHLAVATAFRAVRMKLGFLANTFYAATMRVRVHELLGLLKVGLLASLICSPTAAAGIVPYLNQSWLSPVGEVLSLNWFVLLGAVGAGAAHVASGVMFLASVHLEFRTKIKTGLFLVMILVIEWWVFSAPYWRASLLDSQTIIGIGLLADAVLHTLIACTLFYSLAQHSFTRESAERLSIYEKFFHSLSSPQPHHSEWQGLVFRWRKGLLGRRSLCRQIGDELGIEIAELMISRKRIAFIFQNQRRDLTLLNAIRLRLAPLVDSIEVCTDFNLLNLQNYVTSTGGVSEKKPEITFSDSMEQIFEQAAGFPPLALPDGDVRMRLGRYIAYIRRFGIFAPPPVSPDLLHFMHTVREGRISEIYLFKKNTPGQVRTQLWLQNSTLLTQIGSASKEGAIP